jgi:hypothetical protein
VTLREYLARLLLQTSPATVTDVLGLFSRLDSADPPMTNVLVIFSDGLESASADLSLEDTCVTDANRAALVERAAASIETPQRVTAFAEVLWVVPHLAGANACNGLPHLRPFWTALFERLAGGGPAPTLAFDTNVF